MRRRVTVPLRKIPFSAAPSAEAVRYGMGAVTAELPKYLLAKRRTLADFRATLANLPSAWKPKRLDAFVPSTGYYLDAWNNVRLEATSEIVFKLPGLSVDKTTVFVSEESFDPADDAWRYLSGLLDRSGGFPGRGGIINSTINAIDNLLKAIDAKYGIKTKSLFPTWALFAAAGGAVLLYANRKLLR